MQNKVKNYNKYGEYIYLAWKYHFIYSEMIYFYVQEQNMPCLVVSNIGPATIPRPKLFFQQNGLVTKKQTSFSDKNVINQLVSS